MPEQAALTVVTQVRLGDVDALKALLDRMNVDPARNEVIPFGTFEQLHFARFVVVDAVPDLEGRMLAPTLLFLSDIDEPSDAYLGELVTAWEPGLDAIYCHCVGYPEG